MSILCLSATTTNALTLIHRVKALTAAVAAADEPSTTPDSRSTDDPSLTWGSITPWTIVNKYYSADVHFELCDVRSWTAGADGGAMPAVIFVWAGGESWKHHARRLAQELNRGGCEPEVSLAVRIRSNTAQIPDTEAPAEEESSADVDEFLSELGFEFVDYRAEDGGMVRDADGHELEDDIPDLPRVLDALSTIMWPSMKSTSSASRKRRTQVDLEDWANHTSSPISLDVPGSAGGVQHGAEDEGVLMKEIAELEGWFEDTTMLHDREHPKETDTHPWPANYTHSSDNPPDKVAFPIQFISHDPQNTQDAQTYGFDDDFTVFVSAPEGGATDGAFDFFEDEEDGPDREKRLRGAVSYASLDSLSSFGDRTGEHLGYLGLGDEDEEELPTKSEILATSSRIFGPYPEPFTTSPDHEFAPFDLTSVVERLDGMRQEIANMPDEDARREVAARVAMGLVYGLERS